MEYLNTISCGELENNPISPETKKKIEVFIETYNSELSKLPRKGFDAIFSAEVMIESLYNLSSINKDILNDKAKHKIDLISDVLEKSLGNQQVCANLMELYSGVDTIVNTPPAEMKNQVIIFGVMRHTKDIEESFSNNDSEKSRSAFADFNSFLNIHFPGQDIGNIDALIKAIPSRVDNDKLNTQFNKALENIQTTDLTTRMSSFAKSIEAAEAEEDSIGANTARDDEASDIVFQIHRQIVESKKYLISVYETSMKIEAPKATVSNIRLIDYKGEKVLACNYKNDKEITEILLNNEENIGLTALFKLEEAMKLKDTNKEKLDACKSFVTHAKEFENIRSTQNEPRGVLRKLAEFIRNIFTKKDALDHQKNMKHILENFHPDQRLIKDLEKKTSELNKDLGLIKPPDNRKEDKKSFTVWSNKYQSEYELKGSNFAFLSALLNIIKDPNQKANKLNTYYDLLCKQGVPDETQAFLETAHDTGLISKDVFNSLKTTADRVSVDKLLGC